MTEQLVEAVWEALDRQHDQTWHVHASECCWPFPGAMAAIKAALATATPARLSDEVTEAIRTLRPPAPGAYRTTTDSWFAGRKAALNAALTILAARAVQPTPPAQAEAVAAVERVRTVLAEHWDWKAGLSLHAAITAAIEESP